MSYNTDNDRGSFTDTAAYEFLVATGKMLAFVFTIILAVAFSLLALFAIVMIFIYTPLHIITFIFLVVLSVVAWVGVKFMGESWWDFY